MIGIDQQVQQRMDQFRGRPQDLMQKYQVSRELIDLLALQKLKSEKDSVARNMMMQMQQNPQTIAAQREAELMGRTQQEVAQQVGGIAQLADARRKQNLARMASGQAPQRMAEGGPVYVREGDPGFYTPPALESPETEAKLRRALELGTSVEDLQDILMRTSRVSPGVAEQLVASAARQASPPVTTTVTPEPPRDTARRQTDAPAVGGIESLRDALAGGDNTPPAPSDSGGRTWYKDISFFGRPLVREDEFALIDRPLVREGEFALINRPLVRDGELALGRDLYNYLTSGKAGEFFRTGLGTDAPAVGGIESLRDGLAGPQRQATPSLFDRFAERVSEEQRVTGIPGAIASAVSGQKRAVDSAKEYLARVPGAVQELFSGGVELPSGGVTDYLSRVPGAVSDVVGSLLDGRDAPFEQQPIPGVPPDSLQEIDMSTLPQRRPPRPGPTPADLRAEEEARVREALGQEGIMSAYQDMIRRQQELSGRLQDPEQQRRDRLSALLRGMAGRSTFGLTGAGGSAGLAGERRRQNALAQQLLDKEFGLTREQLGAQVNIGKEALAGGREAFAQASENARSAADRAAAAALKRAELAAGIRESNAEFRADILEALESSQDFQLMRAELAEAIDDGDEQAIREAQADLNKVIGDAVRNRFNIVQGVYPRPMSDVANIERG